jgi:PAT family beta-lactamase induction signal transducer AmpG
MLFLGFSAGLPFMLVFSTLSAWLRQVGIERATIGMLAWVGIVYSIKFLWAPGVDRIALPVLDRLLGRRRAWMLVAQVGIAAGLVNIALSDPTDSVLRVALFALLVAFASATQDIAIDAWRIESAPPDLQGAMAAAYQLHQGCEWGCAVDCGGLGVDGCLLRDGGPGDYRARDNLIG